jgi:DNA processing protein
LNRRKHYRALLALQQVPDLGLRRINMLLKTSGAENAEELFRMNISELTRVDGFGEHIARNLVEFDSWKHVDNILGKTEKAGAELVAIDDEHYPERLRHVYDPPVLLWLKGNKQTLNEDGIAVIGTRKPGTYGMKQASQWSEILSGAGLCINSGLAYGVDTLAHKGALASGGKTVAVLGSGIDVIYPAKNSHIAQKIIETGGAVITEQPPGAAPDAVNFPGRNRIVSGMSHGVLVVESGIKGGSMITARFALDQNREVFVIPHPLDYPRGEGCNYLIRTGQGKLVQSLDDILDEMSIDTGKAKLDNHPGAAKKWETLGLSDELRTICKMLHEKDLHIDRISEQTGKPTHILLPKLLELEMQGAIRQKAGKYFELC